MASDPWLRPWSVVKAGGAIVGVCPKESPESCHACDDGAAAFYGGHMIAESVAGPHAQLIVEAVNAYQPTVGRYRPSCVYRVRDEHRNERVVEAESMSDAIDKMHAALREELGEDYAEWQPQSVELIDDGPVIR